MRRGDEPVSLRRRVQIIFVILALLVIGDMVLDRFLLSDRDALRYEVLHRFEPAREASTDLRVGLTDQETGERGFLISGREEFLEPYTSGAKIVDTALARLGPLVGTDPDIRPYLQRTKDRITAWRQLGAAFEIDAKQDERSEDVGSLVATGTSKMLFDEALLEIADLRSTINDRLRWQEHLVQRLEERISVVRILSALGALGIVVTGSALLRRWLTRPLDQLTDAVRMIARGSDLDQQIPAPGPPELAGLGRDVEAMRLRILDELDQATRAQSSLAQRGMIVLRLRDELVPQTIDLPPSIRVATRFYPAETFVAGDWFDLRRSADNRLDFMVADVSGHGPEAAVFALKTKQLVCIALDQGLSPASAWAWVREQLGNRSDHFLTGVIGSLDVSAGLLTYSSAGHPPLLLRSGGRVTQLGPTGPLVGLIPGAWQDVIVEVAPGSSVTAFTDGLLDVCDDTGNFADLAGLTASLNGSKVRDVEELADICMTFHRRFGGRERDDVTVVVVGFED